MKKFLITGTVICTLIGIAIIVPVVLAQEGNPIAKIIDEISNAPKAKEQEITDLRLEKRIQFVGSMIDSREECESKFKNNPTKARECFKEATKTNVKTRADSLHEAEIICEAQKNNEIAYKKCLHENMIKKVKEKENG